MDEQREKAAIEAAFRRIRTLRWWLAWILVSYFPMVFLLYFLRVDLRLFTACCLAWIVAGIAVAIVIGFSVCPVCGQYFHVRGLEGSTFAKECLNCGVKLTGFL